jgi:hypothetical protein
MSSSKEQQLPYILFIPRWQNGYAPEQDTQWRALQFSAEIATFQVPDDTYLLRGEKGGAELEKCLEIAYPHLGKYDYVIGNLTSGFLWHIVFRLAGDKTPFVIQYLRHYVAFTAPIRATFAAIC